MNEQPTTPPADAMPIPYAFRVERSIVSLMLAEPDTYAVRAIDEGLCADHFYDAANKWLFGEILRRRKEGLSIDLVTWGEDLYYAEYAPISASCLVDVLTYAPHGGFWNQWVGVLRDRAARRRAVLAAAKAGEIGFEDPTQAASFMRHESDAIDNIALAESPVADGTKAVESWVDDYKDRYNSGQLPGLPTGMEPVDALTGGPRGGEMWVVCAESSGGKSAWMLQIVANALRMGKAAMVVSLEMGYPEVIARLAANMGHIRMVALTKPKEGTRDEMKRIEAVLGDLKASGLRIVDKAGLTTEQIAAFATRAKEGKGLDLLVVDYVQLVAGSRGKGESREQEVAGISRALKQLAKELRIPVITASQLNAEGHLRESRAIGHDADAVFQIKEDGVEVVKLRQGKRGDLLPLRFDGMHQTFYAA